MKQRHLDSKAAARYLGYTLKSLYTLRGVERGPIFTRDPRTGKPLYTQRALDAFLKARGKKRAMTLAQACRKPAMSIAEARVPGDAHQSGHESKA
jgi:hypothetical protein